MIQRDYAGQPAPVRDVTVTIDGTDHHGTFYVLDGAIHVRSPLGYKTTWAHSATHKESLARLLLREMVAGIWP